MTGHFEAKKHAYRQTQDGTVISFLIHVNDVSAEVAMAALGTRFMVAFAEIGPDEKPVDTDAAVTVAGTAVTDAVLEAVHGTVVAEREKKRRAFHDLPYSQQAGIRCGDKEFVAFLRDQYSGAFAANADDPAIFVRQYCAITTRTALDDTSCAPGRVARKLWSELNGEFESWQTTRRYKDSVR